MVYIYIYGISWKLRTIYKTIKEFFKLQCNLFLLFESSWQELMLPTSRIQLLVFMFCVYISVLNFMGTGDKEVWKPFSGMISKMKSTSILVEIKILSLI